MQKIKEMLDGLETLLMGETTEQGLVAANHKPSLPAKSPSKSSEIAVPSGMLLKNNLEAQDQLSDLLNQTYAMLKKFGEAADVTAMRDAGFQMVLADYTIAQIAKAFKTYLLTNKEIPTPADIVAIIDPKTQPLSGMIYKELIDRRKKGNWLTSDEWQYIHAYEQNEFRKV